MMMISKTGVKLRENWFQNHSFRVHTPDAGTMFVVITENHDGSPQMITVNGIKNLTAIHVWVSAVCTLINAMWARGISTSDIITMLDVPATTRYAQNENGIKIYSGPDGIKWVLTQFLQMKNGSHPRNRIR